MNLYTIQMASWREAKRLGIPLYDITCKSGDEIFAPERSDLYEHKAGRMSDEEYTRRYREKMLRTYNFYRPEWDRFIQKEVVALACYCPAGKFCHRYLLKDILLKLHMRLHLPCAYLGEVTKEMKEPHQSTLFMPYRQPELDFLPPQV